jgi:pheromone shutdown protein TraB
METNNSDKQRRSFLKTVFAVTAIFGLANVTQEISVNKESKKIKMLTPDGKLVEIDESDYSQISSTQQRASNKEVQDWMKTSKT